MKKKKRVFSETFKREKVRLYETGEMTVIGLCKLYKLSETTVYRWIEKYRISPASERIVVETESDSLKLVELQNRVLKMERLIGNQQIKLAWLGAVIKAASVHYEEDLEKKFG